MKKHLLVASIITGVLLGAAAVYAAMAVNGDNGTLTLNTGRFMVSSASVQTQGGINIPCVIKTDTLTGQSWMLQLMAQNDPQPKWVPIQQ